MPTEIDGGFVFVGTRTEMEALVAAECEATLGLTLSVADAESLLRWPTWKMPAPDTRPGRICGYAAALNRGHTLDEMQRDGFALRMGQDGRVEWTVGPVQGPARAAS